MGSRSWMQRRVAVALAALGLIAALLAGPEASVSAATGPCGTLTYDPAHPPAYQHVVVVMDENLGYDQLRTSTQAPYLHGLGAACGSETNMHAATHPSQPNYMAATSGVATALGVHTANDNVFRQVQAAGLTWRVYAESMPKNCAANSSLTPTYKAGHNPAFWYTDLRTPVNTCALYDRPLTALDADIQADTLPSYSWVAADLCDDMHWATACPYAKSSRVGQGDGWLSRLLPRLTAMPSYVAGKTVVLVTWDEGGEAGTNGVDCTNPTYYPTHPDCHIAAIVLSAYVRPGATDASDQNLYSLLGTTQDVLGLPRLGNAVGQPSMRPGLGF